MKLLELEFRKNLEEMPVYWSCNTGNREYYLCRSELRDFIKTKYNFNLDACESFVLRVYDDCRKDCFLVYGEKADLRTVSEETDSFRMVLIGFNLSEIYNEMYDMTHTCIVDIINLPSPWLNFVLDDFGNNPGSFTKIGNKRYAKEYWVSMEFPEKLKFSDCPVDKW